MKSENVNLSTFQGKPLELATSSVKSNLSVPFAEIGEDYLNEYTLFLTYFNAFPNRINEIKIDCKKANTWFADTYKSEIKDMYYSKLYFRRSYAAEFDDIFYILYEDLVIYFDIGSSVVRFLFRKTAIGKIENLIKGIKKFKQRKEKIKPEITLLFNRGPILNLSSFEISRPRLSIEDNYNNDFSIIHKTILNRLKKKNDKGLVILHGKPGTGKTSYIRYLISSIKKNVIFMPPEMVGAITNPDLMPILIDNPNSVFVIEEAENIVVDREMDGHSPVSALLNLSDGLLSDCMNIQVICSFNIDISKIDNALLRKGRLIAKYEFKELEVEKANRLSRKLGYSATFHSPVTLASVYNQEETDFQQSQRVNTIGFKK